jgi:hypothetical protein
MESKRMAYIGRSALRRQKRVIEELHDVVKDLTMSMNTNVGLEFVYGYKTPDGEIIYAEGFEKREGHENIEGFFDRDHEFPNDSYMTQTIQGDATMLAQWLDSVDELLEHDDYLVIQMYMGEGEEFAVPIMQLIQIFYMPGMEVYDNEKDYACNIQLGIEGCLFSHDGVEWADACRDESKRFTHREAINAAYNLDIAEKSAVVHTHMSPGSIN